MPTALPTLICIPTYNEAENLPLIVAAVHAACPEVHVLVADDASPDGTGAIADGIAARDERVHVLHREGKAGLGQAYLAAFAWGREHGYQVLVEMDADGSHRPEDLRRLLDALAADVDVVLGSRWVTGGAVVDWPRSRELISRAGNLYARVMLGIPVHDATGGFRAYRIRVLDALDLADVASQGYCFQVDLARRAVQRGFTVLEVPITFQDRVLGVSKMSSGIVLEALLRVTEWGVKARLDRVAALARAGRRRVLRTA